MDHILLGAKNPETGRMILALTAANPDFKVRGFLDNDPARHGSFLDYPVFGGLEAITQYMVDECVFVNLITGSTRARYETSKRLVARGCKLVNFIHPSVDLSMTALGVGNYIQQGVIIQAGATIGNNSSIHMGALVAHEVSIGHSVFVAHGACISGEVVIEDGAMIGTNATLLPRIRIGKWSTVGAGAVVFTDVPAYRVTVGNPARLNNTIEPVHDSGDPF